MLQNSPAGDLKVHSAFESKILKNARDLIVYLPPGYVSDERRYPVCYLHDGQNLFDPGTAFLGNDWGLRGTIDALIERGGIQPLIVVGIYNTGEQRINEYTHVRDRRGQGGQARAYGSMITRELKPFIDREYRTLPDSANTGLGGSSLGGLVSVYLGLLEPDIFGNIIAMSPSVWWAGRSILRYVRKIQHHTGQKMWLDVGSHEGDRPEIALKDVRDLRDALLSTGWRAGRDLKYFEDSGAQHTEKAWGTRISNALRFLFSSPARAGRMPRPGTRRRESA